MIVNTIYAFAILATLAWLEWPVLFPPPPIPKPGPEFQYVTALWYDGIIDDKGFEAMILNIEYLDLP